MLKNQPGYKGEGIRDIAVADIACFRNSEDIENAKPSLIAAGVQITNTALVNDVERNDWVGKATVQVIRKHEGKTWVYRDGSEDLQPAAEQAAIRYYTEREAAVAAVAVPDFD